MARIDYSKPAEICWVNQPYWDEPRGAHVEEYFDVAINTIELNEDGTSHVIKFSEYEVMDESKKIWLNMYLTHFSLITDINALRHKVVCERNAINVSNLLNV